MASAIAVTGDVNGQFQVFFEKLTKVHQKQKLDFVIIAGELFASPDSEAGKDVENIQNLLKGDFKVPCTTYFTLGSRHLPPAVAEKLESTDGELCDNLFFLGKRSILKTASGIRIVALGGTYDSKIMSGTSALKYTPSYSDSDILYLQKASSSQVDILVTHDWPTRIRTGSRVAFDAKETPPAQEGIASLALSLKPAYHIATSGDVFFEREPFFHLPSEDTNGLYRITRFQSLASYGNTRKAQKWICAYKLDPGATLPSTPPDGSTASPLSLPGQKQGQKRSRSAHREPVLVYDDDEKSRRRHKHKKRRGPQGPLHKNDCFFCLANNIELHLIADIGDLAYITTAKGPLTTPSTFPKLGFPAHILLIPLEHEATLSRLEETDREATYIELQRYRSRLNAMLKARASEDYGSVTWEVGKGSFPHVHWQFLPVPAHLIQSGKVDDAFRLAAKANRWPTFTNADIGVGLEQTADHFRYMTWHPDQPVDQYTSSVLSFDETVRFEAQFGREILAGLLGLNRRLDWHLCAQTPEEEEADKDKLAAALEGKALEETIADTEKLTVTDN